MAQLKMYWLPGTPINDEPLPEGYTVSNYKDEKDKLAWVECCKNGLIGDDADTGAFDDAILGREDVNPYEDVFFIDYGGEHIGTVTAYVDKEMNAGDMHMVAIRTDFRGRGLAKYLNYICLNHLKDSGADYVYLTTDEWRKGAVKSYLKGGFLPVEYDEGMEDRWSAVLEDYGIDSVQMLYEDASPYKIIYRNSLRKDVCKMTKPVMGIQLYTLRDYIQNAEDFDSTLARLEKMGVTDVQISGIGDIPADVQAEILKKHNMKCCVTHKSFDRMLTDLDAMIEEHKTIGCDAMGIGSAPGESRGNRGNVRKFIAKAGEIGAKLKENGMTFNYHNHSFEFNKLDDMAASMMDLLLEETDDNFNFIPDVAWIHYADRDPAEVLRKMAGKVKVIHFKDYIIDENKERHFVSLGKGVVDLKACYDVACELGIPYIMFEQDNDWVDGDAFKACEESWAFMQSLLK